MSIPDLDLQIVKISPSDGPKETELELSLLAALAHGDSNAFWPLWQRYSTRLFAICLREMRGNKADAEDALGQAMMKALAKLPPVAHEILCPAAWLIRMTRNLCRDVHRQRARSMRAEEHLKTVLGSPVSPADCHEWLDGTDPCQLDADPASLIASLPPRLQEVFALRTIHRMAYNDIAIKLQLTCVNARKRVQQARQALQQCRNHGIDVSPTQDRRSRSGLGSGTAHSVDGKRVRAGQKIVTLRAYVRRHPTGWKKRLKLGDLLYETGAWIEAADCYRHVLSKRPSFTSVALKLDSILPFIDAREEEFGPQAHATPGP